MADTDTVQALCEAKELTERLKDVFSKGSWPDDSSAPLASYICQEVRQRIIQCTETASDGVQGLLQIRDDTNMGMPLLTPLLDKGRWPGEHSKEYGKLLVKDIKLRLDKVEQLGAFWKEGKDNESITIRSEMLDGPSFSVPATARNSVSFGQKQKGKRPMSEMLGGSSLLEPTRARESVSLESKQHRKRPMSEMLGGSSSSEPTRARESVSLEQNQREKKQRIVVEAQDWVFEDNKVDGYTWLKTGQKKNIKGENTPRDYYKCKSEECPAKKLVHAIEGGQFKVLNYGGPHTCNDSLPPPCEPLASDSAHVPLHDNAREPFAIDGTLQSSDHRLPIPVQPNNLMASDSAVTELLDNAREPVTKDRTLQGFVQPNSLMANGFAFTHLPDARGHDENEINRSDDSVERFTDDDDNDLVGLYLDLPPSPGGPFLDSRVQ